MYEKMLVPLDGSKFGEAALPYVKELVSKLAPGLKVEVTLFQVLSSTHYVVAGEAGVPIPFNEIEMEQIKKKATDYLDKMGEGLRKQGAMVKCKVGVGKAAEEIIKVADEIGVGLVAMSTHGRSGFSQWAFGSVAARVLRGCNRPILMVRVPKDMAET